MTSACIIAACASNGRLRENNFYGFEDEIKYVPHSPYYSVTYRLYVKFDRLYHISKDLKRLIIPEQTLTYSHTVALNWSKEISNYGLDNYIQDNIDSVKRNEFWQKAKEEIIDKYLNKVKEDYNISLSENDLKYETELLYTINID
jgi:hypothetical protein